MPKVLLIDNNPKFQSVCQDFLTEIGYELEIIADITTAKAQLQSSQPHIIFFNVEMEEQTSVLWAEVSQYYSEIPTVIISNRHAHPAPHQDILDASQVKSILYHPIPTYRIGNVVGQLAPQSRSERDGHAQTWVGKNLGECLLESYISSGDFSWVYKGTYKGQSVVIKILANLGMQTQERMARFQREAGALAKFKHPNIIEILTTGETPEKIYYMVMPYFPGKNLDEFLQSEQFFSVNEASYIIHQVALGMAAIHTTQIIHRDLKPANILYHRESQSVKVIDFGLVREVGISEAKMRRTNAITRKGYILGTPHYMSPEQCEGRFLDARSDIYSLGITFYQLLTGLVPFDKSSPVKTLLAHIREPVQWPEMESRGIPMEIRDIIQKMTAKKAIDRYQSMMEVAIALSNTSVLANPANI